MLTGGTVLNAVFPGGKDCIQEVVALTLSNGDQFTFFKLILKNGMSSETRRKIAISQRNSNQGLLSNLNPAELGH